MSSLQNKNLSFTLKQFHHLSKLSFQIELQILFTISHFSKYYFQNLRKKSNFLSYYIITIELYLTANIKEG